MKAGILAAAGLIALSASSAASASIITNVFQGTVVAADAFGDQTTPDYAGDFGPAGGSLIGKPFVLTTSIDTSLLSSPAFFTGSTSYFGSLYSPPNPMTVELSIGGKKFGFDTVSSNGFGIPENDIYPLNSDGFTGPGPGSSGETFLQAFYWSEAHGGLQQQGVDLDITPNIATPPDFTTRLPTMFASRGDFTWNYATFYDQSLLFSGLDDVQVLDITSVNAPVVGGIPEPAAWGLLILGLAAVGAAVRRRAMAACA